MMGKRSKNSSNKIKLLTSGGLQKKRTLFLSRGVINEVPTAYANVASRVS